jgi:hypothetical protein
VQRQSLQRKPVQRQGESLRRQSVQREGCQAGQTEEAAELTLDLRATRRLQSSPPAAGGPNRSST